MTDKALQAYREVTEQIQAPSRLKEETVRRMKEEKRLRSSSPLAYVAAVFAGILIIGAAVWQQGRSPQEIVLCESLEEGTVKEQIELSRGSMRFQSILGESLTPGLYLGNVEETKVLPDEEEGSGNTGKIEILISSQGIPKAEEAKGLESCFAGDVEMKMAYYGSGTGNTVFLAYFQADGIGYRVKGQGVSQEEFIRTVLSIVNK